MTVKFNVYGVRGSAPTPGKEFENFGGNTSSYTIRTPSNTAVFLDAGSGIGRAYNTESRSSWGRSALFFSHFHGDHTQGLINTPLPFRMMDSKKTQLVLPQAISGGFDEYFGGNVMPISRTSMRALDYENAKLVKDGDSFDLDKTTTVRVMEGNHPRHGHGGVSLYRFDFKNGPSIVYATDNEFDFHTQFESIKPNPCADKLKSRYIDFVDSADLLLADAQYTEEMYLDMTKGFGHSYPEQIIDLARRARVQRIVLTHHHMTHTDEKLDTMEKQAKRYAEDVGIKPEKVSLAKEGDSFAY